MAEYEKTIRTDQGRAYYDEFQSAYNAYGSIMEQVIEIMQQGYVDEATAVVFGNEMLTVADNTREKLQGLVNTRAQNGAIEYENILSTSRGTRTSMIILSVAGVVLALLLGIVIARIISKPIGEMVEIADKLALGDIDVTIEANYKDETGKLARSFKSLAENIQKQAYLAERMAEGDFSIEVELRSEKDVLGKALNEMIRKINELMAGVVAASEQVATGAKQISDSSMVLSQGSTEQASSIEELTASLEEISSQTDKNAENANKANELTRSVKERADQGNEQMQKMLEAMEEINVSSNNINRIINPLC